MKTTVFSVFILICQMIVFTHVSSAQDTKSMVRVIYFLPNDREPQKDIDIILGTLIKHVQEFYAVNMENHGFGRKSFQIETDRHGKVIVHHVKGKFTETYYQKRSWVWDEVSEQFDMSKNIYLVAIEIGTDLNGFACGFGDFRGPEGGMALLPASGGCFNGAVAAHELGHAFGLAHDKLRDPRRIPALDIADKMTTSFCAAHWVDVHRHFNMNRTEPIEDRRSTIQMLPPVADPPYTVRLGFKVADPDGLHQAQVARVVPGDREVIACKELKGQSSTVEFVTTQLGITSEKGSEVWLRVIDGHGNFVEQTFVIDLVPLLSRKVISIPDANLSAVIRESVGLRPRDRIRQRDMLKLTELNAADRRIINLTGIEHAINLVHLDLTGNQIWDASPLLGLTNLRVLNLINNAISDVSALAGLRDQTLLYLSGNPAFGNPGPKIEGPWLWMIAPTVRAEAEQAAISGMDFLAQASEGSVTEQQIATKGATPGTAVGNKVWTPGKLSPIGGDNINQVVNTVGLGRGDINNHVAYGSIVLDSPRRQETTMYVGSDDAVKVWLNGVLVHSNPVDRGADDYQDFFPVVLQRGTNILLVAVYEHMGGWSGYFGFKNDTMYSLSTTDIDVGITKPKPDPPRETALILDAGLAAAVRETLHIAPNAPITQQAMQRLRVLHANKRQITDLTGLEHATQLELLYLSSNQINDVSPLSGLTQLEFLHLGDNELSDVGPLARLTSLETLYLTENQISDVGPLAGLAQLEALYLGNNEISEVGPLVGLTQLRILRLWRNRISNVRPLAGLVNLEELQLVGNPVTDTSSLASLTELVSMDFEITVPSEDLISDTGLAAAVREALELAPDAPITEQAMQGLTRLGANNRRITDLTGLEHAAQLEELDLSRNQISDVSPLVGLTQLERLLLNGNLIGDVSPLAGLTQLTSLVLNWNQIGDVDPLAGLTQLVRLELRQNQISDVSPLAGLTRLKTLFLQGNEIGDVSPLAGLVSLEKLQLAENPITDTAPLVSLTNLVTADIEVPAPSQPTDVEVKAPPPPISEVVISDAGLAAAIREALDLAPDVSITEQDMRGLTRLAATNRQITDLTGLEHATQLEWLNLIGNSISDVSPLAGLTQLEQLGLSNNELSDVSPLAKLTQLEALHLNNNKLSDVSPLVELTQLRVLGLAENEIGDVSVLAELVSLERLRLAENPATDTSPLASLTNLVELDIEIDASDTTVSLAPAQVPSPAVGAQLTFSLNIANGENVAGYQVTLSYDTSALRYVSSANGDYLSQQVEAFFLTPVAEGDTVRLAATSQSGERYADGTLATATFEVIATKASTVTLTNVLLSDSAGIGSRPRVEAAQLIVPPKPAEDINADGIVNIQDLVLVASNFGETGENTADVNADGIVDIRDLVRVAGAFGTTTAAPSLDPDILKMLTATDVEQWLSEAHSINLTDTASLQGIGFLEQLHAVLIPKETALLPNYPNPFNPETWIPYQLANPADVQIAIYALNGTLVRTLGLGHQSADMYHNKSSAAYWDGQNEQGERVASGVYFYTLSAGGFTATRKLLIRK